MQAAPRRTIQSEMTHHPLLWGLGSNNTFFHVLRQLSEAALPLVALVRRGID